MRVSLLLRLAAAATFAATPCVSAELPFAGPVEAGRLAAPPKNETSGLAASRRYADLLWVHDDSGGTPVLYGVTQHGELRGQLRVKGVRNDDWEDAAAFELDGKPWLLIADTGDNDAERKVVLLHFVEEPAAEAIQEGEATVAPTATLRLSYEDGPRDCEAVAVDTHERALYLLTKRDDVPRLYRVPLPAKLAHANVTARLVGLVPHLPKGGAAEKLLKGRLGKFRARPVAMDIAPDGSGAVVLTYGDVVWFPRRAGEPWAEALAREPVVLPPHGFLQAEAVCLDRDGNAIYVAAEQSRTLLRYDRP